MNDYLKLTRYALASKPDVCPSVRFLLYLACGGLLTAAVGFSVLALIFTGGDSAFANRSGWIYAPWLLAVVLTMAGCVATVADERASAVRLLAAATVSFVVTYAVWPA